MTLTTTSDSGNILGNKHTAGSSNHTGSSTMNVQVSSSSTAVAVAAAAAPIAERATVSVTRTRNNIPSTSTTEEMIDDILFMDVSSSSSLSPQQPQESRLLFPAGSDPNSSSSSSNSNNSHHPPQQPPTHFHTVANSALIGYRSVGIGGFGAIMRYIGMPLEKIALYMNSSQVSITTIAGTNSGVKAPSPFQQAITLTFRDGYLAPYRVVGINSMTAWFMQYSVMGIAFQFFDTMLSNALHVQPMYYGRELMEPPPSSSSSTLRDQSDSTYYVRESFKVILSPLLAASLESLVSNRAEVQRFYGPKVFQQVMAHAETHGNLRTINPFVSYTGPAYMANVMRNIIMCQTSFIITPYTYKMYFPQEQKNKTSLFYYGLSLNIFVGNVIAITQQALWGRSLDYLQQNHTIHYTNVIRNGYEREGMSAFFTTPKWMSRVLMNAPAQGTLPWFYNEILPLGEYNFLYTFYHYLYRPFMNIVPVTTSTDRIMNTNTAVPTVLAEMKLDTTTTATTNMERPCNLQRTRTHYGTLPTANPEFDEDDDDDDNNNNLDDRIIEAVETNTTPPHVPHHHHHKALHHNVKMDPTTSSATATTSPSSPPHEQPPTQR